jgi:CspA family cold shock protein
MARGRVKLWLPGKHYGFVEPDDRGRDVFFHDSVLAQGVTLAVGDPVEYDLAPGKKKIPQAARVARIA